MKRAARKLKKDKGFTIIELLIVIVVMGVLSVYSVARFLGLRTEATRSRCKADVKSIQVALNNWYYRWVIDRTCPSASAGDCAASGFPAASQLQSDNTHFADNFFRDARLPQAEHITGTGADWSAFYDASLGTLDEVNACP